MLIAIIVAMSENRVIGKDNKLPWYIAEDLNWFKRITNGYPIIMGRKTHEAIGRILPGRENIIITKQRDYYQKGAGVFNSLEDALKELSLKKHDEVFIIGGEKLFKSALRYTDRIYLTLIHKGYDGDTFFPKFKERDFKRVFEEKHESSVPFTFIIMDRVQDEKYMTAR